MRKFLVMLAVVAVASISGYALSAADAKKVEPVCIVGGGKLENMNNSVAYKGGKVYFCCENCPKEFEKNTAKYAAKANHQLVVTEQAKQTKCPLSGGKLNPDANVEVGGVSVGFCCNNCKGKVAAAKGDEQVNLVFSDDAFGKGFEVSKAK
jgi:YHS domain-containing protein